jgi:hypothetical protein
MSTWQLASGCFAVIAGLAALYGLHRLALGLEERGWLYYIHKGPRGSAAGCFVALQKAVEPQAQHILLVREEMQAEGHSAGSDRPGAKDQVAGEPLGVPVRGLAGDTEVQPPR